MASDIVERLSDPETCIDALDDAVAVIERYRTACEAFRRDLARRSEEYDTHAPPLWQVVCGALNEGEQWKPMRS